MSEWVEILEKEYNRKVPKQGDLTIQNWLADQSSPDSGCPLIDNPFILETSDDNSIRP